MHGIDTLITAALISGLIGPFVVKLTEVVVTSWKERKAKKITLGLNDPLTDAIENSESVNLYIHGIATEFNFDRAWVSMFHNGGHYYPTGKSIQKFSTFYEVSKPGISTIQRQFTNMPVSLIPKSIGEVYKKGKLFVDIEDEDTFDLEPSMYASGTQTTFIFALTNLEGKFFGMVGFDVVKESRKLTQDEEEALESKVNTLSGYIFEYLHDK